MKVASGDLFSRFAWLAEMAGYKNANCKSVVSSVLLPDFQQYLFFTLAVIFPD